MAAVWLVAIEFLKYRRVAFVARQNTSLPLSRL